MPPRAKLTLPDDMPTMALIYWLDAVGSCSSLQAGEQFPPAPRLSVGHLRERCDEHTTLCQTWDRLTSPWDSPLTIPAGIIGAVWELKVGRRIE